MSNGLGLEGVCTLAAMLQHNTVLTNLNIGNNHLGPKSARVLIEALQHNTVLTTLNLSSNDLGPEGAFALAKVIQHNTVLTSFDLSRIFSLDERPPKRFRSILRHNKWRAAWISRDGGLQRACIVSLVKQWPGMTIEEKTAFKNNARQLPYLIRSRAVKESEHITQIGLFRDERWNSPQQIGVDSGLDVTATESASFFG
jgi:Leucine Rich repeat